MKRWVMVVGNRVQNVTMDYNRPFGDPMWKQIDNDSLISIGWVYDEENKLFRHHTDTTITENEIIGE